MQNQAGRLNPRPHLATNPCVDQGTPDLVEMLTQHSLLVGSTSDGKAACNCPRTRPDSNPLGICGLLYSILTCLLTMVFLKATVLNFAPMTRACFSMQILAKYDSPSCFLAVYCPGTQRRDTAKGHKERCPVCRCPRRKKVAPVPQPALLV